MPRIPTPYKHPKTGVYWVRRHVPEHLRKKLGLSLYQRTLDTKDVGEAKVRFAEVLAELNERWAWLSVEPGRLTMRQSKAIAGEYRRWSIAGSEANPGKPEDLRTRIAWDGNGSGHWAGVLRVWGRSSMANSMNSSSTGASWSIPTT